MSEAFGVSNFILYLKKNDQGTLSIIMYFDNDQDANTLVEKINSLDRGSNCGAGVLCKI